MPRFEDITGQKFNLLTPLYREDNKRGDWICKCDCGNTTRATITSIKKGTTKSCGCFKKNRLTKHGMTETREWHTWKNMLERCNLPTRRDFHRYGGRGISCCKRWNNFKNFYKDMGKKPVGMTIGRIDNDGDYSPENCRWETPRQQANNRRNNRLVTFGDKTKTMAQWSRATGINQDTLWRRLNRGWSTEDALTKPTRKKDRANLS